MEILNRRVFFTIAAILAAVMLFLGLFGVTVTSTGIKTRIDATMFYYGCHAYDLSELNESITGIMKYTQVGKHIVIECHQNPQNNVYFIYNTQTKDFDKIIDGTNLIWTGDDVETIVYSHGDRICRYNGYVIGQASLCEPVDYIGSLDFGEGGDIIVKIMSPIVGLEKYEVYSKGENGYEKHSLDENSIYYRSPGVRFIVHPLKV